MVKQTLTPYEERLYKVMKANQHLLYKMSVADIALYSGLSGDVGWPNKILQRLMSKRYIKRVTNSKYHSYRIYEDNNPLDKEDFVDIYNVFG